MSAALRCRPGCRKADRVSENRQEGEWRRLATIGDDTLETSDTKGETAPKSDVLAVKLAFDHDVGISEWGLAPHRLSMVTRA